MICLSSCAVEGFLFGYVEILENFNILVINLGFFKKKTCVVSLGQRGGICISSCEL
jgi:hypothetical protein